MLTQTKSDKDLVINYLKGDNNSFEFLLNRHKNKVFSYIISKVKNRDLAEDIFQDTFVKVINSLQMGKYNEEGKFLPWIMRIAHNLIIDYFRKSNKMKNIRSTDDFNIFDILNNGARSQEEEMIRKRIHSDLNVLIELLPKEQMDVIKLRYFEEKSFKEIAELTNVSINTALGRMRYALINLRNLSNEQKVDLSYK